MSRTLTDAWELPPTPTVWQWLARVFALCMFMLALAWLASWAHDIWWMNQHLSAARACVAAVILLWLAWAARGWRTATFVDTAPIRLHWAGDQPSGGKSPWLSDQGQPVEVRVVLDAGSHLLLHISGKDNNCYRVVSDKVLPGPWRWRLLAGQPRPERTSA